MNRQMKSVLVALLATLPGSALVVTPTLLAPTAAHAQGPQQATLGTLLSGLINVNVQNVDVNVVDVVDVNNVLNNNQVDVLRNAIINIPIASNNQNVLNNLLRDANLI